MIGGLLYLVSMDRDTADWKVSAVFYISVRSILTVHLLLYLNSFFFHFNESGNCSSIYDFSATTQGCCCKICQISRAERASIAV